MVSWPVIGWSLVCLGGLVMLYGLHRLALKLEEWGAIYYWHKKPSGGGGMGSFVAFQRIIEPQAQHVQEVRHVEHRIEEDEAAGRGPSLRESESE